MKPLTYTGGGTGGGPALPQCKPVLFVTGHAPPDRVGAFARLHEVENVEFALFGGPSKHGWIELARRDLPFPHRYVRQHEPAALATSGRYRAVVCSSGGRIALGATWAGTRRARLPLILWTSLWAHPRSVAHALSFLALRRLYRSADAVVTYGPHVSAYVGARGARNVHVAPQAVDNDFWSSRETVPPRVRAWPEQAATKFLFVGRPAREKGVRVLIEAWHATGLMAPTAALVLAGVGSNPPWAQAGGAAGKRAGGAASTGASATGKGVDAAGKGVDAASNGADATGKEANATGKRADGVLCLDPVPAVELRNIYAACDVLVLPSIATRTFREPWGLVINEAMSRGLAVIASDAVGAAAGGLVRDRRNGLVVPTGDSGALAVAINTLAADPQLRARLGEAGAEDVRAFTYDAWAEGFSDALASLDLSSRR